MATKSLLINFPKISSFSLLTEQKKIHHLSNDKTIVVNTDLKQFFVWQFSSHHPNGLRLVFAFEVL